MFSIEHLSRAGLRRRTAAWLAAVGLALVAAARAGEPTMTVEVDLRDLPKRLVHTTIDVPCKPGAELALWHPKWIPGTHEPCGANEAVAGLRITTPEGAVVPWRRDDLELYRIVCKAPEGAAKLRVALDTICNEATIEASGHLTFGNKQVGVVNWSTCILYPEGPTAAETIVALSARLPEGWKHATALKAKSNEAGLIRFEPVSLVDLIDSPLIGGEHFKTTKLDVGPYPPAFFHVTSESPEALELSPETIAKYGRVVREAGALFGSCHYDEFQFMTTLSDELGYLGLEHLASSINGVGERDLVDDARRVGWVANLIPHEYAHSWCGKYRRPAGMATASYHQPMATRLLWVYEGLTEYLGEVLMVRSGLVKPDDYRKTLAHTIEGLMFQAGRRWRPLDDTAAATSFLRAPSPNWNALRRGQDYYMEGALLWMEIDAMIREKTAGAKSLDDFCKAFLGGPTRPEKVDPYTFEDVVAALNAVAEHDWKSFLEERVSKPLDALPTDFVAKLGYRIEFGSGPPPTYKGRRGGGGGAAARHSLGLAFGDDGSITEIVIGSLADKAGLAKDQKVVAINDRLFSADALRDALTASVERGKVDLLLADGDRLRPLAIAYRDGVKNLTLARIDSKPDVLGEILKPRDKSGEARPGESPKDAPKAAAAELPKGYVAHRAPRPIDVDGKLDEAAWQAAPWTDAFVDIEGDRKPRPRFETRAKMLWDDEYFYVAAKLDEPHVWGTITEHDAVIFQDNDFEVFIDPDGDNHAYYEIEINALNTEWDLHLPKPYRDGGPALNAWEIPGLKKGVAVQGTINDPSDADQSWTVELAFPWKVLAEHADRPAPPADGDQWRVDFSRVEWLHEIVDGRYKKVPKTPEDNWVWSPQGVVDMHRPETWGVVQFSRTEPGGATVAFRPDPAEPARRRLMQIYHAQNAYKRNNGAWADRLEILDLAAAPAGLPAVVLTRTADGYEAAVALEGDPPRTWTVRQDSRLTHKP
ncbi:sugar-binding protein [Paludisphaera mucosa]|uniref:Sugar-binding protein n=1 Tax=Paludisphaera mucosa TaxID=3030827 RepID=A0ABT6FC50_9BACT|nr:sugar-binding protein [Paludisphaera mucosa]MDG3004978.1 sugar-binding protein [Paludisphaera mucosa]